ncbi:hypothetical protein BJ165DRAFT_1489354 [Panaeolus papilionaceus]|nr:hypothetical protein BJ165DRAFT_1489354 [Panaeolus papilionaceus]
MYASGLVFPDYPSDISNEQWRSALRLATTWNFSDIQTKSTQALDEGITDPVERISVAREFKYREWLISGCYDLVGGSTQALEASKCADSLGWKTLALLHQARTEYDWALYGDLPRLANHLNNSGGGFIFTCPVQWCSGMHSLGASGTANCHNAHFPLTVRVAPQKTGFERRDSSLLAIIERTFEDELEGMSN